MTCGEYLHVHGVEESASFLGGDHASFPGLADRQIASVVFFQTQPRVNAQAARKEQSFHLRFHVLSTHCLSCCRALNLLFGSLIQKQIIVR